MKVKVVVTVGDVIVAESEREIGRQPFRVDIRSDEFPALTGHFVAIPGGVRVEVKANKTGRTLHHFIESED